MSSSAMLVSMQTLKACDGVPNEILKLHQHNSGTNAANTTLNHIYCLTLAGTSANINKLLRVKYSHCSFMVSQRICWNCICWLFIINFYTIYLNNKSTIEENWKSGRR